MGAKEKLEEFRDSIEELSDDIWSVYDLEKAYIAVDLIASKLSVFSGKLINEDVSAAEFLSSFIEDGLDEDVKKHCDQLEEFANQTLYDDNKETESKLEEADAARESLHSALLSYSNCLEEKLIQEEQEDEENEAGDEE